MIKVFEDGSTKEYKFKIKKIPRKDRVDDDKYIVRFVDYPNIIGTGQTTVAAFIEAKKYLEVYEEYLIETGQARDCLVETKTPDGLTVKSWRDMYKTTVGDIVREMNKLQKKGIVMNIVKFGRCN